MHDIHMAEVTEDFTRCWNAAGLHIQNHAQGPLQSWLRAHLNPPFLEHLSFRLGNQLFFIQLEDVGGLLETPGNPDGLLAIADGCAGHACVMPMRRVGADWEPTEPSWGTGGEIMSWDPGSRTAVLSEDVSFEAQTDHVIALRMRDGSVAGPYVVVTAGTPNSVVFEDPSGVDIRIATDSERTHFAFGRADHWATLARVITIRPRGDQVEVTCVAENSLVHSADI